METLVRVGRSEDGSLVIGRTLPGRGAWLCRGEPACFDLAIRRKAFERAFRATVDSQRLESFRDELPGFGPMLGPGSEEPVL